MISCFDRSYNYILQPIPIVSSSRWLLRRGELACLEGERKLRGLKTLLRGGKYYRIYLFLFNDLLLVTKMKGLVLIFVFLLSGFLLFT